MAAAGKRKVPPSGPGSARMHAFLFDAWPAWCTSARFHNIVKSCYFCGAEGQDRVQHIVHTPSNEKVDIKTKHPELVLTMDMKVIKNWDDFSAHVLVAKQRIVLHTFFPSLTAKPRMQDLAMDVNVFEAEFRKAKDLHTGFPRSNFGAISAYCCRWTNRRKHICRYRQRVPEWVVDHTSECYEKIFAKKNINRMCH